MTDEVQGTTSEKPTRSAAKTKSATGKKASAKPTVKKSLKRNAKSSKHPSARVVMSAEQLPRKSLEQALRVARALRDTLAGGPASWEQIASAMGLGASTQINKYYLWAAQAYGLIDKNEDQFSLTEIGRKILAPMKPGEEREALVRALLSPIVFSRFFTDYNGSPFPAEEHIGNVLEVRYGVPRERVDEAKALLRENGIFTGVLRETEGALAVQLDPTTTGVPRPVESTESLAPDAPIKDATDYNRMCFVVTPIGDEDSEQRKHANVILKNVIEPVVTELGLFALRADQIDRAGLITQQIFECLAKARLCVADLSFSNPNAFYELGIRHMCKVPTVQIIRKGDKIPFDVSQGRTISIDMSDVYNVIESVESAKKELKQQLRHALSADYKGEDNPVNTYLPGLDVRIPR